MLAIGILSVEFLLYERTVFCGLVAWLLIS